MVPLGGGGLQWGGSRVVGGDGLGWKCLDIMGIVTMSWREEVIVRLFFSHRRWYAVFVVLGSFRISTAAAFASSIGSRASWLCC